MEVPVDRQAFELVCDDIFVAPREARWLSREKGINELFERAAKRVPGEGKTKAQATAVRLSKEWSAVLEVHEVPSSLVKEVRGTPMAAKEIDLLSGSQKPRRALHKLQLDAPVTSAPEEVQLSMPIKRLSIVGGAKLTLERTEALQQFLQQVRPKELDLHEANPALVRALLKRLSTEPKGEHVFKKLDLRGFEVTADDYDLIMRLGHFRRIKFLDLRGHAISGEIAHLLAHLTLVSLGVTTVSEWEAAVIAKRGYRLQALYLDGEWTSFAQDATYASQCVASFVDGDLKVTSSFQCPSILMEELPAHLSILRIGDTLALAPLLSRRSARPKHAVVPAPRQLDLAPIPPDLAEDRNTPRLPEFQRKGTIRFLIETMSAIGLEDRLATGFFLKVYCWLPSHLTVRGLAQDLITAEYDQRKAAGALTGDDLLASLVAIGFQRAVVDSFIASVKDREIVHHQGLRNVAFDLIDSGIHRWAANFYTHSDEPEDGETKRKGSAGRGGRDLGNGGRGRGGGQGGGRGGGRGDDSDNEGRKRKRTNAREGEEEEEEEEEEEVITLFHGTTFEAAKSAFRRVDLRRGRENTDFAIERAFYLGNNASLAQRWADQKAASRGWDPVPAYLVFTVNTRMLAKHRRKEFGRADDEWKKFVFHNRKPVATGHGANYADMCEEEEQEEFDFVIGPALANLQLTKWEDCEEMSDARYPFRQYAALTPRAVDFLNRSPCKLCKWDTGKWVVVAQRPA